MIICSYYFFHFADKCNTPNVTIPNATWLLRTFPKSSARRLLYSNIFAITWTSIYWRYSFVFVCNSIVHYFVIGRRKHGRTRRRRIGSSSLFAYMVSYAIGNCSTFNEWHITNQFLSRSHKADRMSANGRRNIYRFESTISYIQTVANGKVRLFEGCIVSDVMT